MRMYALHGIRAVLSIVLLLPATESAAQDQDALRQQLTLLIHAAPVTDANLQAITPEAFGRQAESILRAWVERGTPVNLRPPPPAQDSLATTLHYTDTRYWLAELEGALQLDGPVYSNVRIETTPAGVPVRYRAISSPPGVPLLTVTAPHEMELEAAWYVFTATDPTTGEEATQTVDCSSDAAVFFRFPDPARGPPAFRDP